MIESLSIDMFSDVFSGIIIGIFVGVLGGLSAIAIDLRFGDPPNRYHPTAWIGGIIARLTILFKSSSPRRERIGGIFIILGTASLLLSLVSLMVFGLSMLPAALFLINGIILGILLKTTIAIRGMIYHALAVLDSLNNNNLDTARLNLSMIVKRDTSSLDRDHVISGVLESTSENIVDGITGPLFYYGLFGLFGAFLYRIVNTADSMIGYRSKMFRNIGWFAAVSDTVLNYIPSRLTGLLIVVSSAILHYNWHESYSTMIRDGKKTSSVNAGYPMAALAGALSIQLEKINCYTLGSNSTPLNSSHVHAAISIIKLTSILFFSVITVPLLVVLSLLGWWIHV